MVKSIDFNIFRKFRSRCIVPPMRVLYALEDYPVPSETYVETELDYFLERGIEVAAWSRRTDPKRPPWRIPVFEGPIRNAVKSWRPDLIHVHWFVIAPSVTAGGFGIPITIRAHSFEYSADAVKTFAFHPDVRAIFLFPHFLDAFLKSPRGAGLTKEALAEKVIPLPSAYNEKMFYPEPKVPRTVVRATAGLNGKDFESFIDTARACPESRFTLVTSIPKEDDSCVRNIVGRNAMYGNPVQILTDVSREETAAIVRRSEICLRSNNTQGHPFGMPISIAESMGAATIPIVRDHDAARRFVGDAGLYFTTVPEAAAAIRKIQADWTLAESLRKASIDRAKLHASSAVLPVIFRVWSKV